MKEASRLSHEMLLRLSGEQNKEITETLLKTPVLRIETIVSTGQTAPAGDGWYDQEEDEWVVLLQGSAILAFEDYELRMEAGSYVFIPAHIFHRVIYTSSEPPCIWLAVFSQACK
jgi:cupin 2 domain-containing protein